MAAAFVKYPADHKKIWLSSEKSRAASKRVRDVRWGDYLNIVEQTPDGWTKIKWGTKRYFIETKHVDNKRPVELIFIDVGQGDGCIYVSSETGDDERIMVIDAGKNSNMFRFLKWRFGKFKKDFDFHAAVITHPDLDHYAGFASLFKQDKIGFNHVYHNGLLERTGADLLGPSDPSGRFLIDIAETDNDVNAFYSVSANRGGKKYPKLMFNAMNHPRIGPIEMASTNHGKIEGGKAYLDSFAPSDGSESVIEIVGPVPETDAQNNTVLRWFGTDIGSTSQDNGKTKNGHSVLLRLTVGNFNVLFGGDLNRPAEDYLLRHYSGIASSEKLSKSVTEARKRLESDLLKCCHHGASDVTDEFIKAVNPFAFIVSSGDNESHAHPRPDLLGRLGKLARSKVPMIFCTEILRSTREKGVAADFKKLRKYDEDISDLQDDIAALEAVPNRTQAQDDQLETLKKDLKFNRNGRRFLQAHIQRRNVGVYGAITVRTDGDHMEISFRLESKRGKQLWQSYILEHSASKGWHIVSGGH